MAVKQKFATGCKFLLTRTNWSATYAYSVSDVEISVGPEEGFFEQVRGQSYDSRAGALYQAA